MTWRLGVALALALAGAVLSAQSAMPPTFQAGVTAVRVDVLVRDGDQPVLGLRAGDFRILDNGVAQHVDLISFDELPLNVVLALDVSDSVSGAQLAELRAAGRQMVAALKPADRAALVTFSSLVSVPVPLTPDGARLAAAIAAPSGAGQTALVDASYTAMVVGAADTGRSLVLVCSDGADTASVLMPDRVVATAGRMNAVVYAVTTGGGEKTSFLNDLAAATGGRVLPVSSKRDLGHQLADIVGEFRRRYVVSYTPQGVSTTGWHTLDVGVSGRHATTSARPGYFAGP